MQNTLNILIQFYKNKSIFYDSKQSMESELVIQQLYKTQINIEQPEIEFKHIYQYINLFIKQNAIKTQLNIYLIPKQLGEQNQQILLTENADIKLQCIQQSQNFQRDTIIINLREAESNATILKKLDTITEKQSFFSSEIQNYLNVQNFILNYQKSNIFPQQTFKHDIGFLYSQPLNSTSAAVSFQKEINNLRKIFQHTSLKLTQIVAKKKNLIKLLNEGVKILHISCHGQVQFLVFQNDSNFGEQYHFTIAQFIEIIKQTSRKPILIILNACKSGKFAQKLHIQGNIPITIGIKQSQTIQDLASELFTEKLYKSILQRKKSIDCYNLAIRYVEQNYNKFYNCCCAKSHKPDCKLKFSANQCPLSHINLCYCRYNNFHTHHKNCNYGKQLVKNYGFQIYEDKTDYIKICCCDHFHNESLKFKCYNQDKQLNIGEDLLALRGQKSHNNLEQDIIKNKKEMKYRYLNNYNLSKGIKIVRQNQLTFIQGKQYISPQYFAQKIGFYLTQRNQFNQLFIQIDLKQYCNLLDLQLRYKIKLKTGWLNLFQCLKQLQRKQSFLILYNADHWIDNCAYQFSLFVYQIKQQLKNTKIIITCNKLNNDYFGRYKFLNIINSPQWSIRSMCQVILNLYNQKLINDIKEQEISMQRKLHIASELKYINKQKSLDPSTQLKNIAQFFINKSRKNLNINIDGLILERLNSAKSNINLGKILSDYKVELKQTQYFKNQIVKLKSNSSPYNKFLQVIFIFINFRNGFTMEDVNRMINKKIIKLKHIQIVQYIQQKLNSPFKLFQVDSILHPNWIHYLQSNFIKSSNIINDQLDIIIQKGIEKFTTYYRYICSVLLKKYEQYSYNQSIVNYSPFHSILIEHIQSYQINKQQPQQQIIQFLKNIYTLNLKNLPNKNFIYNFKQCLLLAPIIIKMSMIKQSESDFMIFLKKSLNSLYLLYSQPQEFTQTKIKLLFMYSRCKYKELKNELRGRNKILNIKYFVRRMQEIYKLFQRSIKIVFRFIRAQNMKMIEFQKILLKIQVFIFKYSLVCKKQYEEQQIELDDEINKNILNIKSMLRQQIFKQLSDIQQNYLLNKYNQNDSTQNQKCHVYKYIGKLFLKLLKYSQIHQRLQIIKRFQSLKFGFAKIIQNIRLFILKIPKNDIQQIQNQKNPIEDILKYRILQIYYNLRLQQLKSKQKAQKQMYLQLKNEIMNGMSERLSQKKVRKILEEIQVQITKKKQHLFVYLISEPLGVYQNQQFMTTLNVKKCVTNKNKLKLINENIIRYNLNFEQEIIKAMQKQHINLYLHLNNLTVQHIKNVLMNGCFLLFLKTNIENYRNKDYLIFETENDISRTRGYRISVEDFIEFDFYKVKILVLSGQRVKLLVNSLQKKYPKLIIIIINVQETLQLQNLHQLRQQYFKYQLYQIISLKFIKQFSKSLLKINHKLTYQQCFDIAKHKSIMHALQQVNFLQIQNQSNIQSYLSIQIYQSQKQNYQKNYIKHFFQRGQSTVLTHQLSQQSKQKDKKHQETSESCYSNIQSICVGRNKQIVDISAALLNPQYKVVIISGRKGSGKTTICDQIYKLFKKNSHINNFSKVTYNKLNEFEKPQNNMLLIIDNFNKQRSEDVKLLQIYLRRECKILLSLDTFEKISDSSVIIPVQQLKGIQFQMFLLYHLNLLKKSQLQSDINQYYNLIIDIKKHCQNKYPSSLLRQIDIRKNQLQKKLFKKHKHLNKIKKKGQSFSNTIHHHNFQNGLKKQTASSKQSLKIKKKEDNSLFKSPQVIKSFSNNDRKMNRHELIQHDEYSEQQYEQSSSQNQSSRSRIKQNSLQDF